MGGWYKIILMKQIEYEEILSHIHVTPSPR